MPRYASEDTKPDGSMVRANPAISTVTGTVTKARRQQNAAASGDITRNYGNTHSSDSLRHEAMADTPMIDWNTFGDDVYDAYRQEYRVDIGSAFSSAGQQRALSSGIGLRSPTMGRLKTQQPTSKEQLANAIRKDFNAAMVQEQEVITTFLYAAQTRGKAPRKTM